MKKYLEYLKYIIKHKWFVLIECINYGIVWRGVIHDLSKLLPDEFIPYAKHFYGTDDEKKSVEDKFDKAWLLHQKRNKHHWQHWILREDDGGTKIIYMPTKYYTEMVCDWVGAGRAIHGKKDIKEWYDSNKEQILVTDETRTAIEKFIRDMAY